MNCSEFNHLLDAYVDGELAEGQRMMMREHASACKSCGEALAAAEQLRDILSHMDDDIAVPLPAQAAWRSAVRAEAKRNRMKLVYRACGAVAAVCVLTFGVTTMLRPEGAMELSVVAPRIETDGVSADAALTDVTMLSMTKRTVAEYAEHTVYVENVEAVSAYLNDLIAEYGGTVDQETETESGRRIYVQIPGENAEDFMSAACGLGTAGEEAGIELDSSAATVGVCVILASL